MVRDRELPRGIDVVIRRIDDLTSGCAMISAAGMAGIFVFIMIEVVARNFAGTSVDFSWEYASYCMGGVFMLGAAEALRTGAHVRVTALPELLSPEIGRRLDLAASVVGLVSVGGLLWAISAMAWVSAEHDTTSFTVMRTPLWIPRAGMAFGAAVFFLQMLAQLVRVLCGQRLMGDDPMEGGIDG